MYVDVNNDLVDYLVQFKNLCILNNISVELQKMLKF